MLAAAALLFWFSILFFRGHEFNHTHTHTSTPSTYSIHKLLHILMVTNQHTDHQHQQQFRRIEYKKKQSNAYTYR